MRTIIAICVVFLAILIILLHDRTTILDMEIENARKKITRQKLELEQAVFLIHKQNQELNKCRGVNVNTQNTQNTQNTDSDTEMQISLIKSRLGAELDTIQNLINTTNKYAIDLSQCSTQKHNAQDRVHRLGDALDKQTKIITDLRSMVAAQQLQISNLLATTYHLAGPINDKSVLNLTCEPGKTINVAAAQYGGGLCGEAEQTQSVAAMCNGKQTCSITVPIVARECPADLGASQSLAVGYYCTLPQ